VLLFCKIIFIIIRPHRSTWPIVTDGVAWSVGLSVTIVIPAKTAEPIKMPFGLWILVCHRNHELDGGPDHHWEGQF